LRRDPALDRGDSPSGFDPVGRLFGGHGQDRGQAQCDLLAHFLGFEFEQPAKLANAVWVAFLPKLNVQWASCDQLHGNI